MIDLEAGRNLLKTNYFIGRYTLEGVANQILNRKDNILKRKRALEITSKNSRSVLDSIGVNVKMTQSKPDLFHRNYFMVCNHMSYIDILVLSSIQPAVFVTSVEMEKTFFLGDIAKLGGSFFVDRVNRRKMKVEVDELVKLLNQGFNVFIFPEGTSTNGDKILPFKKSLFRVPFMAKLPILPICLQYKSVNGEKFSPTNCDRICWYDDMTFAPHFLKLMSLKQLEVQVSYLTPIDSSSFESHGEVALAAQKQIESVYYHKA